LTRLSIPPVVTVHATFIAHGGRLRGFAGPECSVDIGEDSQALAFNRITTHPPLKLWPFAMYAAFPHSDYYGHADFLQPHPRFSGVVSNPLLPLSFTSAEGSPKFLMMDSTRSFRWRLYLPNLYLLSQAPQWVRGRSGASVPSFWQPREPKLPRCVRRPEFTSPTTDCPIGQSIETGATFPVG
jgi:hypothetical protein